MLIDIYRKIANMWSFIGIFCLCFFLEMITFTYLISAIQSIERQFQIPSKLSGALVSAGDIGYILTVVFLSYWGSKGNRARWIGGGCILIALACLLISLPYFVFNNSNPMATNTSAIRQVFRAPDHLLEPNASAEDILNFPPIRQKMPTFVRNMILQKAAPKTETESDFSEGLFGLTEEDYGDYYKDDLDVEIDANTSLSRLKREVKSDSDDKKPGFFDKMRSAVFSMMLGELELRQVLNLIQEKLKKPLSEKSVLKIQRAAGTPLGYCNPLLNKLKADLQEMKCETKHPNTIAFGMVLVGIILIGVGHSMPWTLGIPLIDDNVKKQSTPLYFAGVFFIRLMGPVCGFMLGGACNRLYFTLQSPIGMMRLDPRWIGAWWLGFLIIFALLIIPSMLLFCFPASVSEVKRKQRGERQNAPSDKMAPLENDQLVRENLEINGKASNRRNNGAIKLVDVHREKEPNGSQNMMVETKNFFNALFQVLKCPVYVGLLIGRIFDAAAIKGFLVFLPKYMETHYGVPPHMANIYIGGLLIVSSAIGAAFGSVCMRKFSFNGRRAALFCVCCSLVSGAFSFGQFGLGCHSVSNMVGRSGLKSNFNFTTSCNAECLCDPIKLFPVCSEAGTPYYSPCVAGCHNMTIINKAAFLFNFSDCDCVDVGTTASREHCVDDCRTPVILSWLFLCVSCFAIGASVVPGILIMLRSVPQQYRSVALGFSGFAISLISTLPSPIVYGHLVDGACLLWNTECGMKGSCNLYDPTSLRYRMHGFSGGLRMCDLIFDLWVWFWAKDLILMHENTPESQVDEEQELDAEMMLSEPPL